MTRKYDESDITGFTRDLEKIQAKPQMYIGPTDDDGVYTILRECMDNAVDEARAGRNDFIYVYAESSRGPFWVVDHGVGIPVKLHKKMKISTLTHVLTNLQSSGKMAVGGAYKSSIGTHGVGIKASNALSSSFEVWTHRKDAGGWHYTKFAKGREEIAVKKVTAVPKLPKAGTEKVSIKSGTIIKFTPDPKVFKEHKLQMSQVYLWAKMTSYMNAKLNIIIATNEKAYTYYSKDGANDYLEYRIRQLKATPLTKKYVLHNSDTLEMALTFADVEGCEIEFFTNTVRNKEGGVHADDLYKALFDSLKPFAGKLKFKAADVRDGMIGFLNYKIDAPAFNGQVKEKLVDDRVKKACYEECLATLALFWKANSGLAKDLVKRASELRSKTADFLKDKKLIKNVNKAKKSISTKLAGVVGKAPIEKRELFIVEGDSAGGGAKRARDKSFQAIYPLKGKPLNPIDAKKEKVNGNEETVGLLAALGMNLTAKDPVKTVQYGKVISLADPDVDGMHINCLVLATLWKYTPHLITGGHVYAVKAPLYKGRKGDKVYFGMNKEEVYKQAGTKKVDMTYIKGWGEIDEEDLGVALDPGIRKLYRIVAPTKSGSKDFFSLMGKSPSYRKDLLGVEA
jgi:DNA gyrase/topoisomerase IV subunit B